MQFRLSIIAILTYALVAWVVPGATYGQTAKAVVLAWDGTVPSFVDEMVREGKLPNLAKLIAGGAFADDVMAGFPSKTAPGFASLMTGAPPRLTGISGNRVPREPRADHTILDSVAGFCGGAFACGPHLGRGPTRRQKGGGLPLTFVCGRKIGKYGTVPWLQHDCRT